MTKSLSGSEDRAEQQPLPGDSSLAGRGTRGAAGHALRAARILRIERVARIPRAGRVARDLLVHTGAVGAALAVGVVLVVGSGASVGQAAGALADGMAGTPYALGSALNAAAVLALIATGFTVAYRAGLVNVGGEGQLGVGGIGATAVGVSLPDATPAVLAVSLVLGAGFCAGAAWAAIAAWLKARRGVNEVITTLLLNFVGLGLVSLAVHEEGLLRQPVTSADTLPQSEPLAAGARLPLLGLTESPATIAVLVAVAAAVVTGIVLHRTATGTRLSAVGQSPPAARRLGLSVARLQIGALATAGGLAGTAGAALVATVPYVLAENFTSGYGFAGLVVGLLARGSLTAVAGISLLFGMLAAGGINLQLAAGVPASSVQVVQSVLIILIAGAATLRKETAR
ncbi:ABC transporter permease subunit [Streptomyces sp. 2A115]|uniref:ABC transporter permease subunit n=1 Tax=Streptomyces sp. 2A115 TaxID=3457439 RepID=UPI003FD3C716